MLLLCQSGSWAFQKLERFHTVTLISTFPNRCVHADLKRLRQRMITRTCARTHIHTPDHHQPSAKQCGEQTVVEKCMVYVLCGLYVCAI